MATTSQVPPLRISKSGAIDTNSTPNKMASSRPLAEIGSTERRRNSPSYIQATKKMIVSREASPYTENSFTKDSSPRLSLSRSLKVAMVHGHQDIENDPEQADKSLNLSPTRRASIEKLKQAGRVKTSNIFALENKAVYDPSSLPIVERPLGNRPLSQQLANNNFTRYDSIRKENNPLRNIHTSPGKLPSSLNTSPAKSAGSSSPTKSSLARTSQFSGALFDGENSLWSDDEERRLTPRGLRQNKSVTFREEPPIINEYEQPTPEPSISASEEREGSWDSEEYEDNDYSFERGSSMEHHDDSFDDDLENADKTPVVLPEQWSRVSPEHARTDLADEDDDVFTSPSGSSHRNFSLTESVVSDSESRPLPPIPGMLRERRLEALNAAAERAANARRGLPTPPKRSAGSREESQPIRAPFTMDERMDIMGFHREVSHGVEQKSGTHADARTSEEPNHEEEQAADDTLAEGLDEYSQSPPRISRESILRKVRSRRFDLEDTHEDSFVEDSPPRPSYAEMADFHPDQPIPSRETSQDTSNYIPGSYVTEKITVEKEIFIKEEPVDDDEFDMSAIPAADVSFGGLERHSSVLRHRVSPESDEDETEYTRCSTVEPEAESTELQPHLESTPDIPDGKETLQDAMQLLTLKDFSQPQPRVASITLRDFPGLPSFVSSVDYDFGINKFMSTSPPPVAEAVTRKIDITSSAPSLPPPTQSKWDLPRPTYDGAEYSLPGTPDSVVHRGEDDAISTMEGGELAEAEAEVPAPEPVIAVGPEVSIEIPERRTTIKTRGKLKTRPSATPADLLAMAEQRYMVDSTEHEMPETPEQYRARDDPSHEADAQHSTTIDDSQIKRQDADLSLNVPNLEEGPELGLDKEFDRLIEGQKKGYLMRQNTKLVVASNRNFSNESSATALSHEGSSKVSRTSAVKGRHPSGEQVLKTEPWNGKTRRQSQRHESSCRAEPAPPLPGHKSALGVVEEDFAAGTSSLEDEVGEDVERGRLFVKVVGIKDLELPLPTDERTFFQLTLDNGLHCVTTSDLEMGRSAPIGQEFELVVLNDLEFQLTLTTQLTPPARTVQTVAASSAAKKSPSKGAAISRFLSSPKKRAERERQEREALEAEERKRKEDMMRKRASVRPSAWDLLHELVSSNDGSFARAYINLRAHEKDCFGRALTVNVPCYNEWALEKDAAVINSVRSKRGNNAPPVRRPPYVIGHLQLQLLYIPRPKGAVEEDMPKSMSAAVREIKRADQAATENVEVVHEGYLSQQGGDCQHWRRRFFRLQGVRLTAYHEHTNQKRAVINLSKASRLVDDKTSLVADPIATANNASRSRRRKSAFAEEDEGYAYVETGFRIRFANGETIDFYADKVEDKAGWMQKLAQIIGNPNAAAAAAAASSAADIKSLRWVDLVHAREKSELEQHQKLLKEQEQEQRLQQEEESSSSQLQYSQQQDSPQMSETTAATDVVDFAVGSPTGASAKSPASPMKSPLSSPKIQEIPARRPVSMAAPSMAPPVPEKDSLIRPSTPPMSERRAHRNRNAVKSMIF